MPIIRTSPEIIAQYESSTAINQSGLKDIMFNGIQSYLISKELLGKTEKYFEDKEHFIIGKAADVIMSFEQEVFNSIYYISELEEKPSDTMMKVLHMTLQHLESSKVTQIFPLDNPTNAPILHSMLNLVETKGDKGEKKIGYYMNRAKDSWQDDGRMKDILKPECANYWRDIVLSRGKQVISLSEKSVIDTVTNSWKTHPHTASLFVENSNIIQIYQYPVYFVINGVWCKGLIDKIDINIIERTITIFDFKTMKGFTLTFPRVIKGRRYDFQLSFYYEGLRQSLSTLSDFIGLDVTHYMLRNPVCIVESTNNPGLPMQFELSDSLLLIGQRGDDRLSGYEQMLGEYQYWYSNGFDIPTTCLRSTIPGRLIVDYQFTLVKP
jgi:hypothetical protein